MELVRNLAEQIKKTGKREKDYRILFLFLSQQRKKIEEAQTIEELEKIIFWRVSAITIVKGGIKISMRLVI